MKANVKKVLHIIFYPILLLAGFIGGYLFNRRRVSGNSDNAGRIRDGIDELKNNNNELTSNNEQLRDDLGKLGGDNDNNIERVRKIRERLQRAKERSKGAKDNNDN